MKAVEDVRVGLELLHENFEIRNVYIIFHAGVSSDRVLLAMSHSFHHKTREIDETVKEKRRIGAEEGNSKFGASFQGWTQN